MHQHYSYEYKRQCVEMYRQGLWPETPEHFKNPEDFHKMIRRWKKIEDANGPWALKTKTKKKQWSVSERYELVAQVLAGNSIKEVSCNVGIDSGQLCQWVKKYKIKGYDGLENLTIGRPRKYPEMKKACSQIKPLSESEREELIRLRAENEYIKAENEVIKKEIALREEKQAALLKAKRQRLSKNLEKKGSD